MKRTLALAAAWTGSAAAAVGLGFLAVSLVDASAAPGTQPVSTGSSASATPTSSGAETPAATPGEQATVGGTVLATCAGGAPGLAIAPAAGWWVDDSGDPSEVEFRNGTQKIEVYVDCVDGSPRFAVEGPRVDDSGGRRSGSSSSPSSPASSSASESTSGRDDSSGDDSSGRGGGHGSDDSGGDDSGGDSGGGGNSGRGSGSDRD